MTAGNRLAVIVVLGTAQTLAWASSFYLPAILGDRIAEDLGISSTWFFAAFSGALVVSAILGPRAGQTVDAVAIVPASLVLLYFAQGDLCRILSLAHLDDDTLRCTK
jgi:hypothetical protein